MDFEKFLHWLNVHCKDLRSTRTLGGRAYIKAELIESGRFLLIEYSKNSQLCCITMDKLKLIFDKYFTLDKHKHMASQYTDPEWQNTPSRICAPYAAALIRDFENDFIPPQEGINTAMPSGDQLFEDKVMLLIQHIKSLRKFNIVEPDISVPLVKFIQEAGIKVGINEYFVAKKIVNETAKRMGIEKSLLDHSIRNFMSTKIRMKPVPKPPGGVGSMPNKGDVFKGKINDLCQSDASGWRRRDIVFFKHEVNQGEEFGYPNSHEKIILIDTGNRRYELNFSKPDSEDKVCLGTPSKLKPWYQKKGYDEKAVGPDDWVYCKYTGAGIEFLILTEQEHQHNIT